MKRIVLIFATILIGTMSMMAQNSNCGTCNGKGYIRCPECHGNPPMCQICKGLGNIVCRYCHGEFKTCPVCHGSKYYNGPCSACSATGRVIDCSHCNGKGYEKCPGIPRDCFNGNKVCHRCDGLNNVLCPDCQK